MNFQFSKGDFFLAFPTFFTKCSAVSGAGAVAGTPLSVTGTSALVA